jgi:hypothetical protein
VGVSQSAQETFLYGKRSQKDRGKMIHYEIMYHSQLIQCIWIHFNYWWQSTTNSGPVLLSQEQSSPWWLSCCPDSTELFMTGALLQGTPEGESYLASSLWGGYLNLYLSNRPVCSGIGYLFSFG